MLGTGIALWALFPGPQIIRFGYVELFYPRSGVLPCGLWHDSVHVRDRRSAATGLHSLNPLRAMGECSLSIYILHSVIIAWIIGPADILLPLPQFLLCISVFAGGMCAFAYLMRHIRPRRGGSFVVGSFLEDERQREGTVGYATGGQASPRTRCRPWSGHFFPKPVFFLVKIKNPEEPAIGNMASLDEDRKEEQEVQRDRKNGTMRIDQRLTSSTRRVSLSSVNFRMRIPETSTITSVA